MKNCKLFSFFYGLILIFSGFIPLSAENPNYCHEAFQRGLDNIQYYKTPQGNTLRYTLFESPLKKEKQTIFFVQGRATFLEFYEVLITPLLERGFDVWTYDLSGQGGLFQAFGRKLS